MTSPWGDNHEAMRISAVLPFQFSSFIIPSLLTQFFFLISLSLYSSSSSSHFSLLTSIDRVAHKSSGFWGQHFLKVRQGREVRRCHGNSRQRDNKVRVPSFLNEMNQTLSHSFIPQHWYCAFYFLTPFFLKPFAFHHPLQGLDPIQPFLFRETPPVIAMMESMESCVPPGFRFHPTDEELVGYYLRKKIASQKIDLDVIREIDLYRIEPWDLTERCRIGYEEQNEWYFFSHKDKKYPTGTRTNRATMAGFWKATGRDKAVYDKAKLIGMRKTLVFYKGRAPNGQKTDWIMHEYRLELDENGPPQEEGWVVCRAFKKRTTNVQTKTIEGWDSSYFLDEANGVSSVVDPIDLISRQPQSFLAQSFLCKQEIEADNNLSSMQQDQFVQLPQLESPSLPLVKRPSTVSLISDNNNELLLDDEFQNRLLSNTKQVTTDWRDLDKFVASQLSQEEIHETTDGVLQNFETHHNNSDMALLLLQSSRDEGDRISPFLNTSSDCDIGICVFEK
ncbi:hypothetical protein RJT34_05979 [Clitoria ternatea]|uniref:NAC domain-containing protein n=1 Tax=Clitoria ternatea TaxID=43366 RepID=A0AAN9K550_CLITE